ncbi:hypothetical protein AL544_012635 [Vibrio mimicus]|uniref:Uncharacterized protein n=1 Tax=Vibrio mimicus TaxID=674 RepID=A0A2J9UZB9_VIBMI|nr:hypothetical protein AL544_012635 [Vibrio mimicus]
MLIRGGLFLTFSVYMGAVTPDSSSTLEWARSLSHGSRSALIPFLLGAAAVLAAFVHPNHIVCLCSWGFTHLPPTCNSK